MEATDILGALLLLGRVLRDSVFGDTEFAIGTSAMLLSVAAVTTCNRYLLIMDKAICNPMCLEIARKMLTFVGLFTEN